MAGAGFAGGFAKMLCDKHNAVYKNIAVGGGTITSETYYTPDKYPDLTEPKPRHWICRTIENMTISDYNILEGGINDFYNSVPLGEITPNYTSTFDETTFCGAFESMLKQIVIRFQGKKYGFIITHKINNTFYPYGNTTSDKFEVYYEKMIEMLNKCSFPYLDLFKYTF